MAATNLLWDIHDPDLLHHADVDVTRPPSSEHSAADASRAARSEARLQRLDGRLARLNEHFVQSFATAAASGGGGARRSSGCHSDMQ